MAAREGEEGLHSTNIEWFIESVEDKPTVDSIVQEGTHIFRIDRERDELLVYLANIYILGVADIEDILSRAPEVDVVVNVNSYNTHTNAAKDLARKRGVALFRASEFMGAIYRYGQEFMDYSPPG
jgi:hypothetical protein